MGRCVFRGRAAFCAAILSLSLLCIGYRPAYGAFIRVPDDASSIQAAVDQASAGDTVAVRPNGAAPYVERVVIAKEIVLLGGWDATFSTRDPQANETIVDAAATDKDPGQCITFTPGLTDDTVLDGFSLTGGLASLATANRGGGIYCEGSSPIIRNNNIHDNRAHLGAGIECRNGANAEIVNNNIHDNIETTSSGLQGCGITCERSSPRIADNTISYNKGSGVRLEEAAPVVENNTFLGNTHGAGVACLDGSNAIIRNNVFKFNRATFGGAVWIEDSSPTVEFNLMEENQIQVIEGEGGGAGLSCFGDSGGPTIRNNIFLNNHTSTDGGGIIVKGSTTPTIEHNLFKGNYTSRGGGAIVVQEDAAATIRNNTFYKNESSRGGTILVRHNATATLQRNIIFGSSTGSGIWVDAPASVTLDCNCVSNNLPSGYVGVSPGATDILLNPILCRTDGDTLDLAYNSPCLPENPENNGCGLIGAFGRGNCGAFPTNVSLIDPEDGAVLNDDTPTFVWSKSVDPDGGTIRFDFEIDEDPEFETALVVDAGGDTSYTLQPYEALEEDVTLYYWHAIAYDEQDNSTTSDQIRTLRIDMTSPTLTLGVHQHPYLDSYMDLYAVADEPLAAGLDATLTVGGSPQDIDMELIDPVKVLYYAPYEMTTSGTAIFDVSAEDLASNSSAQTDTFSIKVLRPGEGATFASPDGGLALSIKSGSFQRSAYFLVKDLGARPEAAAASQAGPAQAPLLPPNLDAAGDPAAGSPIGHAYSVTWSPASPASPVELRFRGEAGDGVSACRWNGQDWEAVTTYRDPETKELFALTSKPGLFQLRTLPGTGQSHATALLQNFPNPFRSTTTVAFTVGGGGGPRKVSIKIFDVKGRLVRNLLDADLDPGPFAVTWDGRSSTGSACSSGLYLYRLEIENERPISKKMLLAR